MSSHTSLHSTSLLFASLHSHSLSLSLSREYSHAVAAGSSFHFWIRRVQLRRVPLGIEYTVCQGPLLLVLSSLPRALVRVFHFANVKRNGNGNETKPANVYRRGRLRCGALLSVCSRALHFIRRRHATRFSTRLDSNTVVIVSYAATVHVL